MGVAKHLARRRVGKVALERVSPSGNEAAVRHGIEDDGIRVPAHELIAVTCVMCARCQCGGDVADSS